jgi:Fuc2NAc and GlcNAc transferase
MAYWQIGAAGLVSLALTWVMLAAARRHHFVDTPNTRSSHHRPTPRGGGLAFALVISAGLGWLAWQGPAPLSAALTVLALGGLLIALCGLVDDLRGLGALPRLVLQLAAAAALVYSLPSVPDPLHPYVTLPPPVTGLLLVGLVVWTINLYNFMDGSDGIACLQALLACGTAAVLDGIAWYPGQLGLAALWTAAAVAGFAVFNAPPAKIFMGDSGSAYLGFVLIGLAVVDSTAASDALWLWLILLAWFVSDASVTLVTRILRGASFLEPHRSHVYQLLLRQLEEAAAARGDDRDRGRTRAHRLCLAAVSGVFVLWQLPLALLLAGQWLTAPTAIALTYLPLCAAAILAGAGGERLFPYSARRKKHSR